MASTIDSQINPLVYNYLLKICPKSAKIFAKSTKFKSLPPDSPTLEDLLCQRSSQSSVSEATKSISVKSPLKSGFAPKQDSSSDDSDSESEADKDAPKIKSSAHTNVKKLSPKSPKGLPAKKQSSSDESSSEDEKQVQKKSPVKQQQVSKGNVSQPKQKQESSSSEDSDSELTTSKTETPKPNNWTSAITKFAAMSDSSSDSEDENEIVSLAKKPAILNNAGKNSSVLNDKKSTGNGASSSDSSSESEADTKQSQSLKPGTTKIIEAPKGMKANKLPAQKKDSSSSDSSSESDKEASSKSIAPLNKNVVLQKHVKGISKKSSSDESSSDSDDEKKIQVKPTQPLAKIQNKGLAQKKQVSSSDDSSSESESVSKPSNIKSPNKKVSTSLPKTPAKSKVATPGKVSTLSVKGKNVVKKADSDSDSSSDEEETKGSLPKKNMISTSVVKGPISTKPAAKKDSSSSSDSEEELSKNKGLNIKPNNTALQKGKNLVTKKMPMPVPVQKQASSSSDDSSSDEEIEVKDSTLKKGNVQPNKIVAKSSNQKKTSSSSDSSSDSDKKTAAKVNVASVKQTSPLKKVNVSVSKQSSSDDSSSDSDSEKQVIQTPTAVQQGKMNNKAQPGKVQKRESSSDDSSSDSDSASKPNKPASAANRNMPLTKTPGKINSAVNIKKPVHGIVAGKSPIQKAAQSSSDSSSDEEPQKMHSTPVAQNQLKIKESESSESDSDAPTKTALLASKSPIKQSVPNLVKKRTRASSSDSDSSDEDTANAAKSKPVPNNAEKLKPPSSLKRKHGASEESSDSSESEGESKLHTSNQLPTQPQKKQKLNNSESNLSVSENTPIASDSTKKRRGSSPFRRIKDEKYVVDQRLQKSSAEAKHFIPALGASKGKQFRHEKTKKKRNNSAGKIDLSVNSIKFE